MKKNLFALLALTFLIVACGKKEQVEQTTASGLLPSKFEGMFEEKDSTHLYVMKNANGMEVCVTNIGGRIVSVLVPDKTGAMKDVVLGFDNIEAYKGINTNFGAIIGRYGNRIAGGKFELYRVAYELRKNNGNNSLHGGPRGFHTQYFNIAQPDSHKLVCKYFSKTGEEGFPGNLDVTVTYTLTNDNALDIAYEAKTDRPTVVNLTNHSYFNLSGNPNNTILDHILTMDCNQYTPTNDELIPTGIIAKVEGTPLDFRTPTAIGTRIDDSTFIDIKYGKGYDHNFVINNPGDLNKAICKVVCPSTGIVMEVFTNEPGIQFYTGNFLDGTSVGKKGIAYQHRTALCLETQHFPDSPNQADFPSTTLDPDNIYTSKCIYKFSVE